MSLNNRFGMASDMCSLLEGTLLSDALHEPLSGFLFFFGRLSCSCNFTGVCWRDVGLLVISAFAGG